MKRRSGSFAAPPRQTSFYESFSDLIFGTLVLFIVMVMALALKLQESVQAYTAEVEEAVYPGRFVGGTSPTKLYMALLPVGAGQEPRAAWIPDDIASTWYADRNPGGIDPILDLCRIAQGPGFYLSSPAQLISAAPALGQVLRDGWHLEVEIGYIVYLLERYEREDPRGFRGHRTPESLRDAIGGIWANLAANVPARFVAYWNDYFDWAREGGEDPNVHRKEILQPAIDSLRPEDLEGDSRIRITSLEDGTLVLGGLPVTPRRLVQCLSAITPGSRFTVEYVDANGAPAAPSEEVFEEVLVAAGFDRRVLTERAERTLVLELE